MKIFKTFFLVTSYWLLLAPIAFAALINIWKGTSGGGCNQADEGCTICDAIIVAQNIVKLLFQLSIPLVTIIIVWGGIVVMTAGGSEERMGKGKKIITDALIGLVIILLSWSIVNIILHLLTGKLDFPWHNVKCS